MADIKLNEILHFLQVCKDKPTRRPSIETDAIRPLDENEVIL